MQKARAYIAVGAGLVGLCGSMFAQAQNSALNIPSSNNNFANTKPANNNFANAKPSNGNHTKPANTAVSPGKAVNSAGLGNNSFNNAATLGPDPMAPKAQSVNSVPSSSTGIVTSPVNTAPLGVGQNAPPETVRAAADAESQAYESQASTELRQHLKRDLETYCMDYCTVLNLEVAGDEVFDTANADLGFEGVQGTASGSRRFKVKNSVAEVLVDTRFGSDNIKRMRTLFERLTPRYGKPLAITWTNITFPETASTQKSEADVRGEFAARVKHQIERIITQFCPTECKLNGVDVKVVRATMDEAEQGSVERYLYARDGRGALFVTGVNASISINAQMDGTRRSQISAIVREALIPFGAVSLDVNALSFPRSYDDVQKDADELRRDPYGVEKIGALLKLFRENLVSKEVYKETNTHDSAKESARESASEKEARQITHTNKEQNNTNATNSSKEEALREGEGVSWPWVAALVLFGILVVAGALTARSLLFSKQMKAVMDEGFTGGTRVAQDSATEVKKPEGPRNEDKLRARLELQEIHDEILGHFVANPKAARDVFTRVLKEDGTEVAAKYVAIFGEIVVYELLRDLDLKDYLNTLAEYVHQNAPVVEDAERLVLLRQLKLKLTAAKVKLLANRTLDVFDFLKAWSPRQVYELAHDETPSVQGIILTQLTPEKRRGVFDYFAGEAKSKLLQALSQIDMMPREYLIGTAQFLKQKAQKNPMFDSENVRGSEVLMDLLAKSDIAQQRALIAQLDASNPQSSWMIRNSLITPESLIWLRENIVVDLFLDMDPTDVAVFLNGCPAHVKNKIIARTPREISANWIEQMATLSQGDVEQYQLAEMKVLNKVRQWASKGQFSIAEINEKVYPRSQRNSYFTETAA